MGNYLRNVRTVSVSEEFDFVEDVPPPKVPAMFSPPSSQYTYRKKEVHDIPLFQAQCQSDECEHWTGFYVSKERARRALGIHSC